MRQSPRYSAWADTESPEERAAREVAWQAYRCCRDCRHWIPGDDNNPDGNIGCCGHPENAGGPFMAFMVPEDFTCPRWEALERR